MFARKPMTMTLQALIHEDLRPRRTPSPDPAGARHLACIRLMKHAFVMGVLLIGAFCGPEARADTTVGNFTISGGGISASGTISLATTATPGVDEIVGITGTFSSTNGGFSGAITGMSPGSFDSNNPTVGLFRWDNLFYPTGSAPGVNGNPAGGTLDDYGMAFMVAGGYTVNLFEKGVVTGFLLDDGVSAVADYRVPVTFTVTATTALMPATLPHVASGEGFDTLVLLINTGTAPANYSLQFFSQSGAQVTYPLDPTQSAMTGSLPAGSQAIVRTTGSGSSTSLGWGQLTAPPAVKGMIIYQQQASASSLQEGSAPIGAASSNFFVPFDNTEGDVTSIGFANPSASQTATINLTLCYETGSACDQAPAFTLGAQHQNAQALTSIWPASEGQKGLMHVSSSTPLGLVAFRFQGSAFTLFDTIPPAAAGSTPVTSTIAHVADGDNFRTTIILTNSGSVAASYSLTIFDAQGQTQTFGLDATSSLTGIVEAGTTRTINTTGLGTVTNLGWAQLVAPPSVSGIAVFRQTNPGQNEQQASIPITQTNLSHFFLPFDNAANTTSIALANPDPATTATINVTFRYADGTSKTGQTTLAPRNYTAQALVQLFPQTSGAAGVAEFVSNTPIAVVELRFNPTQAFTSLRAVSP